MNAKSTLNMAIMILLSLSLCLYGCNNGGGGGDNDGDGEAEALIDISGVVKSVTTNDPIGDAQVSISDESTTTDTEGRFSFTMLSADIDIIAISKDGFVYYQKPLHDHSGDTIMLEPFLMPVDETETIDPTSAGNHTITNKDGASVTIPPLSEINENLVVSLTNFNVITDDILAIPGDFSAIDEDQNETNLISQGVINVDVKGETSGDIYSLNNMADFEIRIPISGDISTAPDTIPLWYFDNALNLWVEQGSAARSGDYYIGTVTHFSAWNADIVYAQRCCISGKITDPIPGPNEMYQLTLQLTGVLVQNVQTSVDFAMLGLPLNKIAMLEIKKRSTGEVWIKHFITPSTESSIGNCYDVGDIPGLNWVYGVGGLKITNTNGVITISWDYEPIDPGFDHVIIVYASNAATITSNSTANVQPASAGSITVPRGVKTVDLNLEDLEAGMYTFSVKAVYSDETESAALVKRVKVYDSQILTSYSTLTLEDNDPYCGIGITVEFDDYSEVYSEPVEVPNGNAITLIADPAETLWQYSQDSPIEVTWEAYDQLTFTTESDVSIGFACNVQ